jgi:hypothetical protein
MFVERKKAIKQFTFMLYLKAPDRWFRSIQKQALKVSCLCLLGTAVINTAGAQVLVPGTYKGWGSDSFGQTTLPVLSPPITNINAISSAGRNTVALRSDGTVFAWGAFNEQLTTVPAGLNDVKAIAASEGYMMALRRNGNVVFWGSFYPVDLLTPEYLQNAIAIAAGTNHAMILRLDGTVIDLRTTDGSMIQVPAGLSEVSAIAAGISHALALKKDGSVVAWGNNNAGQISVPPGLTNVIAIAASAETSFALKDDYSVVAWGSSFGGLTITDGLPKIKAITAGRFHALGITLDDAVTAWGVGSSGETTTPSGLMNVNAISAGNRNSFALNAAPLDYSYTFSGFQPPVNTAPVINIGKAGRTYPVKWQLRDQDGNFVSALTAVKSVSLASVLCGTFNSAPADAIEIETTGETMLRYDNETNQFIYNWKTPRESRCYLLFFTLDTGQVLTAKFNLTK